MKFSLKNVYIHTTEYFIFNMFLNICTVFATHSNPEFVFDNVFLFLSHIITQTHSVTLSHSLLCVLNPLRTMIYYSNILYSILCNITKTHTRPLTNLYSSVEIFNKDELLVFTAN